MTKLLSCRLHKYDVQNFFNAWYDADSESFDTNFGSLLDIKTDFVEGIGGIVFESIGDDE